MGGGGVKLYLYRKLDVFINLLTKPLVVYDFYVFNLGGSVSAPLSYLENHGGE